MNILIVRVSAIGDVIHTLPAFHLLRHALPQARIDWIVQRKASSLLMAEDRLHRVWELPDHFWKPSNVLTTLSIINELRRYTWDAILDFQGIHKTSLLIGLLSGRVFGFSQKYARSAVTAWLSDAWAIPDHEHIVQKNLALARLVSQQLVGNAWREPSLGDLQASFSIPLPLEEQAMVDTWFEEKRVHNAILLAPNTTWASKHWPLAYWQQLIKHLLDRGIGSVLLTGSQFHGSQAAQLSEYVNRYRLPVYIVPPWSLRVVAYCIKKACLVIAPDTGLLHLADFLGTSTIGFFGPTHGIKHGPALVLPNERHLFQIDCLHYYKKVHSGVKGLPNEDCMYKLAPDIVYNHVARLIHQKRSS